jgi:hypothetical protein
VAEGACGAARVARFGAFELHDLLALKAGGCGVLVSIAKDSCKVLLNKVRRITAHAAQALLTQDSSPEGASYVR